MNLVATVVPNIGILAEGVTLATGTRAFVGRASIEGEATDSVTHETLVAGVDRRQGGRDLGTGWSHVEDALKHWAHEIGKDFGSGNSSSVVAQDKPEISVIARAFSGLTGRAWRCMSITGPDVNRFAVTHPGRSASMA